MAPSFIRKFAATAVLIAPLGVAMIAQPAAAQHAQYRVAQVEQERIVNMTLFSNAGLRPGATLRVHVYATPGARWASATLGEARVRLVEQKRGEYYGTYTIRPGDEIDPRDTMTVRAGWGHGPVTASFDYPPSFQALAAPAHTAPAVERFSMVAPDGLEPGEVVRFRLEGTPRAQVAVSVPGVVRGIPLREVRPGLYVGRYTVRRNDDLDAFDGARAVLRSGNEQVVARVGGRPESYGYGYGNR